ncbi:MAG: hypothetical protein RBT76_13210 [candidate division Zixibacteria bacterium]|jgi:hypothetical protein|nr:hypothetical protein [candidate division Zixibacteria bacterium]
MLRAVPVFLCTLIFVLTVACSDDDSSVNSTLYSPVVGSWLVDSASSNGVVYAVDADTFTYRSDRTGSYRSVIGWGACDFIYSIRGDSLLVHITSGQGAGSNLSYDFELSGTHLVRRYLDGAVVRITFMTRRDR